MSVLQLTIASTQLGLALFEAGYQVKAIRDGISSFDEHSREPWLANIDKYLGDVIALEQFGSVLNRPPNSFGSSQVR